MAKRLSKPLWYGTGLDTYGKPLLPPVATNESDLNGLHRGELFMHLDKKEVTLWALSSNNEVVQIAGKQGEIDIDLSDYLLKSTWDKVWELRKDNNGVEYIYSKLPVVTQYGITMYGDNDELNIPDIYEGLPIDNVTLYWDNGVLKAKGGEGGGGGEADSIAWANVYGKPSWITDTKPIYNYSEIKNTPDLNVFVTGTALSNTLADYATLTYLTGELKKYVTIKDDQDIVGVKNFLNGIKISHMPIRKLQDDVIYIDANVVVRGGVTMYYQDGEVDLPSIIDEIGIAGYDGKKLGLVSFSSSQFSIDANGNVIIKGGSTGLDTAQLKDYLDSNKYTTETWVKEQGYASASSLSSLQTKVDNFLEGSDTDTIINKWKELEAFLSGLSESDNLATILSTKWTTDNNLINQWNTAYGWGDHSKVGYALKSYVDSNFVTLGTKQTITGEKNFTGGLKVNGSPIYYDATNKYWKLEGDLLVTGGVSMYSDDSEFTPSTIMDGVVVDGTSIRKNPTTGALEVIGGSGSTTKYPLSWSGFNQGSYDGSVAQSFYIPTRLSEFVNDKSFATTSDLSGYLPTSGGTVNGSISLGDSSNHGYYEYLVYRDGSKSFYAMNGNTTVLGNSTNSIIRYVQIGNVGLRFHEDGNFYDIWHSGNDGAGSGLDADLLDGKHYSDIINGNVASATKLQTPRTIWGQSFDGSANVTGNLTINNGKLIFGDNTYIAYGNPYLPSSDGTNSWNIHNSNNATLFKVRSNGNVLIGAITDSGYKLDITNKDTNNVFIARGKNAYFRVSYNCIMGIESNNGGWILYSGPARGEAARFEVMDKNSGWVATGWMLFSDGNMLIGSGQNNGYKLDVNGTIHTNSSLWIDNIEVKKSQDDVLYIDGNLVVRGGVTMYAENEVDIPSIIDSLPIANANTQDKASKGIASFDSAYFKVTDGWVTLTSAPSSGASYLGKLDNVDDSIDATASVDRVLYQPAGSAMWTWRELPKDGVVGNYLPLSGGTLNGTLSIGTTISSEVGRATLGLVSVGDNPTDFKMGNGSQVWSITARNNANRKNLWFYSYESSNILIELDATFNAVRIGRGTESLIDYLDPEYSLDVVGTLRSNRGVFKSSSANILSLYRTESGGGAWIDYYAYNQTSSKWRVGAGGIYDFMWEAPDGNYPCRIHYNKSNGIRFEIGKDFTTTGTITDPSRATLTLISTSDNPTDLIMGANAYDWSITARGSYEDYFLGFYSNRNSQYVVQMYRNGNVLVTGGITMYSDQRKKTILNHVELSLKQIANAPLIEHYYNSDQDKTTHVGSIAQYWAELNDWFCKLDNEGYYTMEVQNCALASAISIARHLEKYESKTDKKIRMLKKRVQELEEEVERLKQN